VCVCVWVCVVVIVVVVLVILAVIVLAVMIMITMVGQTVAQCPPIVFDCKQDRRDLLTIRCRKLKQHTSHLCNAHCTHQERTANFSESDEGVMACMMWLILKLGANDARINGACPRPLTR
jgi:hypothetical protein